MIYLCQISVRVTKRVKIEKTTDLLCMHYIYMSNTDTDLSFGNLFARFQQINSDPIDCDLNHDLDRVMDCVMDWHHIESVTYVNPMDYDLNCAIDWHAATTIML